MIISISPSSIVYSLFHLSHSLCDSFDLFFFLRCCFSFGSFSWLDLRIHFHFYDYYYDCNDEYNEMEIIYSSHAYIHLDREHSYFDTKATHTHQHQKQHISFTFDFHWKWSECKSSASSSPPEKKRIAITLLPFDARYTLAMEMRCSQFSRRVATFWTIFTVKCENIKSDSATTATKNMFYSNSTTALFISTAFTISISELAALEKKFKFKNLYFYPRINSCTHRDTHAHIKHVQIYAAGIMFNHQRRSVMFIRTVDHECGMHYE